MTSFPSSLAAPTQPWMFFRSKGQSSCPSVDGVFASKSFPTNTWKHMTYTLFRSTSQTHTACTRYVQRCWQCRWVRTYEPAYDDTRRQPPTRQLQIECRHQDALWVVLSCSEESGRWSEWGDVYRKLQPTYKGKDNRRLSRFMTTYSWARKRGRLEEEWGGRWVFTHELLDCATDLVFLQGE